MTTPPIDRFDGEYRFLSNFWPCKIMLDGEEYASVEHTYQAAKTLDPALRLAIREIEKPGAAKKYGAEIIPPRHNWNQIKLWLMFDFLRQKFADADLREKLIATGDATLIEGNDWHDLYWGVCTCGRPACKDLGENNLGRLLMLVRRSFSNTVDQVMKDERVIRLVDFARRHLEHDGGCPKYGFTAGISVPRCLCGADMVLEMFREAFLP